MMSEKLIKQRRAAVKRYAEKVDRVNCLFPSGTKDRIKKLTGQSCNSFIKETVLNELDRLEYKKNEPGIFL